MLDLATKNGVAYRITEPQKWGVKQTMTIYYQWYDIVSSKWWVNTYSLTPIQGNEIMRKFLSQPKVIGQKKDEIGRLTIFWSHNEPSCQNHRSQLNGAFCFSQFEDLWSWQNLLKTKHWTGFLHRRGTSKTPSIFEIRQNSVRTTAWLSLGFGFPCLGLCNNPQYMRGTLW